MKNLNVSNKMVYILLAIFLMIPIIRPMGLPFPLIQKANLLYQEIEGLQPGQRVMFLVQYHAEIVPQAKIVLQHLFKTPGVKIVIATFAETGLLTSDQIMSEINTGDKVYGEDYIRLPYVPGQEVALAAFAKDPLSVVQSDYLGAPIAEMGAIKGVTTATDFDLWIMPNSGADFGVLAYVRQLATPYGVRMAVMGDQPTLTLAGPFVQSGQIFALMAGTRGAAEYELLMSTPGTNVASMDAQSLGHLLILGLLILGNISGFLSRKSPKAAGSEQRGTQNA